MSLSLFRLSLILTGSVLTGCTAYSTGINHFAPARPLSDLRPTEHEEERVVLSEGRPLFCPAPEVYMVMPEEDKVGVIDVVLNNDDRYRLVGEYAGLRVSDESREVYTGTDREMMNLFGEAIEYLPPAPTYYTVYFKTDTTELTPESRVLVEDIYLEILRRPVPELIVIGHTDTRASTAYNLKLSAARAELVRQQLIAEGADPALISLEARGESDLHVDTPDNTDEPKNRRVVINVR